MRHTVKLPKVGDTTTEVVILGWHVAVGDAVVSGEPLIEVETDKVDMDVDAPVSGILVEQLAAVEETVAVGTAYAVIEARP